MAGFSEIAAVEQPAITLFAELGYETVDAFHEAFGPKGTLGREHQGEVVLLPRLRAALTRLNPVMPREAIEGAVEALTEDQSAKGLVHANQDVYKRLKDGVKVRVRDERGEEADETVRVVDWNEPGANDFLLVSQLWVQGEIYKKRPDVVVFVNGLPLVDFEFKGPTERLRDGYDDNILDYWRSIPALFWSNAFVVISNGSESRVGTVNAPWEHFSEWKRVADEQEPPVVSLETMIRGTCAPGRLLDLVESFSLFSTAPGALTKLLAKNHQYLGVNAAFGRLKREFGIGEDDSALRAGPPAAAGRTRGSAPTTRLPGPLPNVTDAVASGDEAGGGRLGVFWHTQGSGKSYSMV